MVGTTMFFLGYQMISGLGFGETTKTEWQNQTFLIRHY